MSDTRLDAMSPRKRGDKTFWTRVGSAWPNKNGVGYQIVLDALPLPDSDGRCVINLFAPKPQESRQQAPKGRQSDPQAPLDDWGDPPPF